MIGTRVLYEDALLTVLDTRPFLIGVHVRTLYYMCECNNLDTCQYVIRYKGNITHVHGYVIPCHMS